MNCLNCNHVLPTTARFCGKCGTPVERNEMPKIDLDLPEVKEEVIPLDLPADIKPIQKETPVEEKPVEDKPVEVEPPVKAPVIIGQPVKVTSVKTQTNPIQVTVVKQEPAQQPIVRPQILMQQPASTQPSTQQAAPALLAKQAEQTQILNELKTRLGELEKMASKMPAPGPDPVLLEQQAMQTQMLNELKDRLADLETAQSQIVNALSDIANEWLTHSDIDNLQQQVLNLSNEQNKTQQALGLAQETIKMLPMAINQSFENSASTAIVNAIQNLPMVTTVTVKEEDEEKTKPNNFLMVFVIGMLAGLTLVLATMTLINLMTVGQAQTVSAPAKAKPSGH
jgi:hypothetical protein